MRMNKSPDTVVKARGWVEEDRIGIWLSKPPEERVRAVGIINLTIEGERYAAQRLQRVLKKIRRQKR
jgi:hypothetical protein